MRHTTADFEGMRKAGHLAASTLDKLVDKVKPGVSTAELDDFAFDFIDKQGGLIAPLFYNCLLYTSPSPRDGLLSRMPSSA